MDSELRAQVEQRVGRNLLRYQMVEARLKTVLPLRQITVSNEGLESLARTLEERKRWTLGQLMEGYPEAFETAGPEAKAQLEELLRLFVDARNQLVHHLLQEHTYLSTPAACRACIERLDNDYRLADDVARQVHELHQLVLHSLQSFLEAWAAAEPGPSGMIGLSQRHAERLAEHYGTDVHVELQIPLLDALAEILDELERTRAGEGGWTVFHPVGSEFQRRYQTLPRGVLAMATQLDKYEFAQRSVREGAGKAWMFRRRREPE